MGVKGSCLCYAGSSRYHMISAASDKKQFLMRSSGQLLFKATKEAFANLTWAAGKFCFVVPRHFSPSPLTISSCRAWFVCVILSSSQLQPPLPTIQKRKEHGDPPAPPPKFAPNGPTLNYQLKHQTQCEARARPAALLGAGPRSHGCKPGPDGHPASHKRSPLKQEQNPRTDQHLL